VVGHPDEVCSPPSGPGTAGFPRIDERYRIEREIGRGAMGRVFVARDRKLGREVAIKVLAAGAHGEDDRRRLLQEARAAGSLEHPNIVAVHDVATSDGASYIVSELLHGTTLQERIAGRPLPLAEAFDYALQLARGLSAAHEKGVVHRDLKPANLFVTSESQLKILDFGIAKVPRPSAAEVSTPPSTETGAILGTVGYMSPEQVRGHPADHRADIFSFGAIVYEMLSGRRAFAGGSPIETSYAILTEEPPPLPGRILPAIDRVVRRCLHKDPERRFQTTKDLVYALESVLPARDGQFPSIHLRGWRKWAFTALLATVGTALVVHLRAPPPPMALQGVVAVLPFATRGDSQVAYLGEGFVDLLSRELNGTSLRAIEPRAVIRAADRAGGLDAGKASSLVKPLGARLFVLGSVDESAGNLRLRAALYRVDRENPDVEASAEGPAADVLRLTEQIADQLRLRASAPGIGAAEREGRLARQTTQSAEALKAFLEGETLRRRSRWSEVIPAFQRAIKADPEFALAHYRLGEAASFLEPGLAEDALQRALRFADRLTPEERGLVEGRLAAQQGRWGDAERIFVLAVRDHPDDPEAWLQLGEHYFHGNPLRARTPDDARAAFERVLVLDPTQSIALAHLIDLAQLHDERALAAALCDRFLALSDDDPSGTVAFRLTRAWAGGDLDLRRAVLSDLRDPGSSRTLLKTAFVRLEWLGDDLQDAWSLGERLASSGARAQRAEARASLAAVALMQGRPAAARRELARALELDPGGESAYYAAWLETLEFVPVTPDLLEAARATALRIDVARNPDLAPAREFLLGALALRGRNRRVADAAAKRLEELAPAGATSVAADLALDLRARMLVNERRPAEALAALEKQRLHLPFHRVSVYQRVADPLLRAAVLEALGRHTDALKVYDAVNLYSSMEPAVIPVLHLRKASSYARRDRDRAIRHYRRFLELWKDSEPELRPLTQSAREQLARLELDQANQSTRVDSPRR
jgi:tetratricopeptide (TPR) repeat protein